MCMADWYRNASLVTTTPTTTPSPSATSAIMSVSEKAVSPKVVSKMTLAEQLTADQQTSVRSGYAAAVAPVQDTTTQAPDDNTSPHDTTTPLPQRRRLLQGGGGEGRGGGSTLSPDENCFKCPPGTVSDISNNTGHAGIDACACPAGFSAPHSRAGQTGCGDDPCCGAPCPNTSILNSTSRKLGLAYCVDGNECLD